MALRVASSGVSQESLSDDHVRQILNRLVFDSLVEEVTLIPALRAKFTDLGPYYRSTPQNISHYDNATSLPVRGAQRKPQVSWYPRLGTVLASSLFAPLTPAHSISP